jgi:hypothetical protein
MIPRQPSSSLNGSIRKVYDGTAWVGMICQRDRIWKASGNSGVAIGAHPTQKEAVAAVLAHFRAATAAH